jgi:hypothetical protein
MNARKVKVVDISESLFMAFQNRDYRDIKLEPVNLDGAKVHFLNSAPDMHWLGTETTPPDEDTEEK